MVNYHGLKNMIWVWTKEANDDAFYPGDQYVDIVGRDYYNTGDHGSQIGQFNPIDTKFGGKKIVTISECGSFPDPANLVKDNAPWSWYMTWYGDFVRSATYNSLDLWKSAFAHSYVLTLKKMPGWKNYCATTGISSEETSLGTPAVVAHIADRRIILSLHAGVVSVKMLRPDGSLEFESRNTAGTMSIDARTWSRGVHLLVVETRRGTTVEADSDALRPALRAEDLGHDSPIRGGRVHSEARLPVNARGGEEPPDPIRWGTFSSRRCAWRTGRPRMV